MSAIQRELLYIELKSGRGDRGPAWIGKASYSRSRQTVYFHGRALKRIHGGGAGSNHACLRSGEEFWVSRPKRAGGDRHWAGGGEVQVEAASVDDYLRLRGLERLPAQGYRIVHDIVATEPQDFHGEEQIAADPRPSSEESESRS